MTESSKTDLKGQEDIEADITNDLDAGVYMKVVKYPDTLWVVLDWIISGILIAPLTAAYWRSSWYLLDAYMPASRVTSGWVCLFVGAGGSMVFYLLSHRLSQWAAIQRTCNVPLWLIVYHIYTYVFAWVLVFYWYGIWILWDYYAGISVSSGLITAAIGFGVMAVLRATKNIYAPPLVVAMDISPQFFTCGTRFKTMWKDGPLLHIADCFLSACIIAGMDVFFWRGTRTVLNLLVYPQDPLQSFTTTCAIGYSLFFVAGVGQFLAEGIRRTLHSTKLRPFTIKVTASLTDMVLNLVASVSSVAVFRAVWVGIDFLIQTQYGSLTVASSWIVHAIGIGGLMLTLTGNCAIPKAGFVDGEAACMLPNQYARHFRDLWEEKHYYSNKKSKVTPPPTISEKYVTHDTLL